MDQEETLTYKVRQAGFEGPLELLLSLIEQKKLFINEFSLAQVTDEYIAYMKSADDVPKDKHIANVSYFVLVAATLILIKSKSLLPNLALTDDEEEKIVDLENRLKLYKIIKNASIDIDNQFGTKIIFTGEEKNWNEPIFAPDPCITVQNVFTAISETLNRVPKKVNNLPEVEVRKVINIDEVINSLSDRIEKAINLSFREFSKSHGAKDEGEAKVHVIVSFLAMLELVREGIIDVIQNASFGDIEINKQTNPMSDIGTNI